MKVLLTHGYFIKDDPNEMRIMKPYPPLGLLFISGWLKKLGMEHDVYDTTFKDIQELKSYIKIYQPGIIGMYSTLMTKTRILEIIKFIRQSLALKQTKIIIGGPDVRYNAENYLKESADVVVPGEGEEAFAELVTAFTADSASPDLLKINGINFTDDDGLLVQTDVRPPLDLREVPMPNYDFIDVNAYLGQWKVAHGFSSMTINSMRGCPYSCNWCSKSVYGNSCRRRTPEAIVKELILLMNTFKPDQVWFTDDVFTLSKPWLRDFKDELLKNDVIVPYECITRSDCLDEEVIDLLKYSGCKKVWIGAESGSQKVIDLMNRKIDLEHTSQMVEKIKSVSIAVGTFIMLGYPGENRQDIFMTARFLENTSPDDLTFGIAYPIIGTRLFQQVEPAFDTPYKWTDGNERKIRFKRPYSDRFYRFSIRYLKNAAEYRKTARGLQKWIYFMKAFISKAYIAFLS
jgi:anaerobic magnesium-protoporphyrin IX monomethyl ester cyclase